MKLKIGLVQAAVSDDADANLEKAGRLVKQAAGKGASIVCLQELFAARYFCQHEDKKNFALAEAINGKVSGFLERVSKDNGIVLVGGSLFEKDNGKYYNTSLVFDKGKEVCKYRKVHIPYDPGYCEKFYFTPGEKFVQADVLGIKIAPLICYDQWFPEAARVNALKGAQILFYPTAIGWSDSLKKDEPFSAQRWEDAMRSHASLNNVFVAAVNRVGREEQLDFWGGSFIADPYGQVVVKASSSKDEVLVAEIDLSLIDSAKDWGFMENRAVGSYSEIINVRK